MRFVRDVKEAERQELERMTNQEIGRVSMRASMILLSSRGYTVPEIVDIHKTTNVTVYKWFDRFDEQGPAGYTIYLALDVLQKSLKKSRIAWRRHWKNRQQSTAKIARSGLLHCCKPISKTS